MEENGDLAHPDKYKVTADYTSEQFAEHYIKRLRINNKTGRFKNIFECKFC